jgi:hypothetical protein
MDRLITLTCYIMTLNRMKRINTSSNRPTKPSYVIIRNMLHSRRQIRLNILFHLELILASMLHVPRLLIYQEQVSVSTSFIATWRIGKPSTPMADL